VGYFAPVENIWNRCQLNRESRMQCISGTEKKHQEGFILVSVLNSERIKGYQQEQEARK